MRRLTLVLSTVCLAAGLASFVLLIAAPEAYTAGPPKVRSEGSLAPRPQAVDPAKNSPSYSQIVDNATRGRFTAPKSWGTSPGDGQQYGGDYRHVEPSPNVAPARFKLKIPETDYYTIYARWPALAENSGAARFGISTASGTKWVELDQRTDGGLWVRLGDFEMKAGDRYTVQVSGDSKGEGRVIADAIKVVRGTQVDPEEDIDEEATGDTAMRAAATRATGADVVRQARKHIGTPYRLSPPGTCRAYVTEDCSCLTKLAFKPFGTNLPEHPVKQWNYGRYVAKSNLRPGDVVFFKEAGPSKPITHVGIYSGNGNLVHASSYWGEVVERPMKYIYGYYGAKRMRLG